MLNHFEIIDCRILNSKIVCFTLDLEQDYGDLFEKPSFDGLKFIPNLIPLLKKRNIPLTVFVQGSLFEKFPNVIEQLSVLDTEFELHSYSHLRYERTNTKYEVESGIKAYRTCLGKYPKGYRFPSGVLKYSDYEILASSGLQFDSSVFPSLRPGYFNNLNVPTKPYYLYEHKIVELPLTVFSRYIRIPIALSYIKLLGWPYLQMIKSPFLPDFIIFNFHMHDLFTLPSASRINDKEFSPLNRFMFNKIYFPKKNDGFILLDKLIDILKARNYIFVKLETIHDSIIKGIDKA